MTGTSSAIDPSHPTTVQHPRDRQILACLGDRYVVFGSGADLPDRRRLGPEDAGARLPRTIEPRQEAEAGIAQSLVVEGFDVRHIEGAPFGDLMIVDKEGRSALIEIKVGDRTYAGLDLGQAWTELDPSASPGERRELWAFDTGRLDLHIIWSEGGSIRGLERLAALDVWAYEPDGAIFERRQVVEELDAWLRCVEALYADVEAWTRTDGVEMRRDRTVPMSEGFMRDFAVPDRDMPVLDVFDHGEPLVSFVPSGLLAAGFRGMIDAITRNGTFRLEAVLQGQTPPRWTVTGPRTRERMNWDGEALRSIIGLMPVGE